MFGFHWFYCKKKNYALLYSFRQTLWQIDGNCQLKWRKREASFFFSMGIDKDKHKWWKNIGNGIGCFFVNILRRK
jgi:hypothetical protein